ncbi:hypothetical protein MKW98_003764 [Papaver atlanticum]|uniref:Uncharacterized protein n=1 Tax=Papaver atlanticum TaxID=357466 RepID=A0AAD4XS65_9MAGN|nr:hypothetical protein MKW98_003764 [Papaver atlanticum]
MVAIKLGSTAIGLKSKGVVVVVEKSITSPLLLSFLPNHFLLHKLAERWGRPVYANIQLFIQFHPTVDVAALPDDLYGCCHSLTNGLMIEGH